MLKLKNVGKFLSPQNYWLDKKNILGRTYKRREAFTNMIGNIEIRNSRYSHIKSRLKESIVTNLKDGEVIYEQIEYPIKKLNKLQKVLYSIFKPKNAMIVEDSYGFAYMKDEIDILKIENKIKELKSDGGENIIDKGLIKLKRKIETVKKRTGYNDKKIDNDINHLKNEYLANGKQSKQIIF